MKRARWIPVLVAGGLLSSCGEGLAPPTTGSIALLIQLEQAQGHAAAPALSVTGDGVAVPSFDAAGYTSARATADGPTPKSVDLSLVDGFWEGTLADLNVGTYTVTVEGFESGALAARGVRSGVSVTAGAQTSASVTLTSFVPGVNIGIGSPTTSLELPVSVSTVQGADGYRVQWANNPGFSGASSQDINTTSAVLSVSALGTYYVRARALSGSSAGAPGDSVAVDVVGDVPPTGSDAGTAPNLGFGVAISQRLTQLNIVPANDADWFSLGACTGDTVIVETFATRLSPASKLNSYLRLFDAAGTTQLAENDDLDGTTTDSRVQHVLQADGQYTVQVTSAPPGTVGRYELALEVRSGATNPGTYCQFVSNVVVTPATASLAPGATQQLSAAAFDSTGAQMANIRFLWVSSNSNVAVVDTTGRVTAVGGGSATISAVGQGEPGNAVVTVSGTPLGTPTQLVITGQPATTTAGAAFSPAVEVEIRDANGNLVTGARNTVTLTIANNPGGATLFGTTSANANGGIARFAGVYMDKAAAGYTLAVAAASLTGATSNAFAVSPGTPTKLSFGQQPTSTQGNVVIAPAVTATILDAFGNVATSAGNAVTVDFGANVWKSAFSPGATLLGTKTANAVNGVATFNALRVDKPGSGYTLAASAAGLTEGSSNPFAINLTVQSLRAGTIGYHTCAVTAGGTYCWGRGYDGQLGDGLGTYTSDSVARLVSGGLTFTQVTAGVNHTCALTAAGAAYCWGYNGNGQLGNNTTTPTDAPVAVSGGLTFSSISAGASHTCGRTAGATLYCWGYNGYGQLGDNTTVQKLVPTLVVGGLSWASVSGATYHTCGLTTGGSAYCWGYDAQGQLGNDAALANQSTPVVVAGGRTWSTISGGYYQTCGVDVNGAGLCWGRNTYGMLGADTTLYARDVVQATPVPVFGGLTFSTIATGYYHSCGLTTTGSAYCWGRNYEGQLGDGSTVNDSPLRVAVAGGITFSTGALSAGRYYTCGRAGTATWCWGQGGNGNLGNGAAVNKNQPVQIVQ